MRCIVMITGNLICVGAGEALGGMSPQAKWGRLMALWLCSCQSVVLCLKYHHYYSACTAIPTGYCAKTVLVMVLYAYMWSGNERRDREAATGGSHMSAAQEKETIKKGMQDMTEIDNQGFRYVL
ncbi:hypothetical protein LTR53_015427 [Teratosphaeriaceae sp. CCFEE 6253]|nr:hypothetical protein LTR53_015427 [Teratosphaeriaceae sp. CCFEE 6253]